MGWIARSKLAAAVSNAGALGMIETSSGDTNALIEELSRMKDLTDRPFGVNIAQRFVSEPKIVDILARFGIRFVTTSAGDPSKYIDELRSAGIITFHVVPNLSGAAKALAAGVDGLVVEGSEGGGFKSSNGVATFVLLPLISELTDKPIIAAGGIADGRSMAAAFALGAEAVQIGTRILATEEAPIHDNFKNAVVSAASTDTVYIPANEQSRSPAMRALRTPTSERYALRGVDDAAIFKQIKRLYFDGDMEASIAMCGQVAGRIASVERVETIIDRFIGEFRDTAASLGGACPSSADQCHAH